MCQNIISRFRSVEDDEGGAETIEVVLLTVFFVLVVGAVALLIKTKISDSSTKLSRNFDQINNDLDGLYTFGS